MSVRQVIAVITYLVEKGLIVRSARHKNFTLTNVGRAFLKEKPEFYIPNSILHVASAPLFASKLTTTHKATLQFWQRKRSVASIAKIRHITEQIVEDHLVNLVYHGKIFDIGDFVDKERQSVIQRVVALHPNTRLKILKDQLPESITFVQIKFMLAAQRHYVNNGI